MGQVGFHGRKLADDLAKTPRIPPTGIFLGDFLNMFWGFNGILMIFSESKKEMGSISWGYFLGYIFKWGYIKPNNVFFLITQLQEHGIV